ncbi:CBS domain-containing protein [Noviherbaspirillum autotrophicum]|uniref:Inosine-5-monophosphate dehydrogenase n=1 Tax=Noviherbaspirillum autotrophicum TaxID=709839 RepID=A0A0C2BMP1_9BURK|nr:CBS domain-containing protein [Noviherbaspirillum autotrophicum]KIF82515.1 inosine-5-monophosphate dehydrogenase [Noviherbaspirillum autotrophicum]
MRVAEAMTRDVRIANPDESIIEAAKMMADCDCGVLPVGENDRLVGMITDRDIVVRALAQGKPGDTRIRDVMSSDVKYCLEEDDVDDVARNMSDLQIRRLPVLDKNKRLTGIVSLGDIATTDQSQSAAQALHGISEQSTQHSGSGHKLH